MAALLQTRKHKDLIFDVGLHRGEDAEFYLRKGFRVVAFEANPELVAFCRERLNVFLAQGQLRIVEGAVVAADTLKPGQTTITFYRNEGGSVWGTVCAPWAERNEKTGMPSSRIEVTATNFEKALEEHGVPHYMKVDIEGCDLVCLNALDKFQERPDYVSFESDKTSFVKIRSEINLLRRLGYDRFVAVEQSGIVAESPPLPAREGKYTPHRFENGASGLFGAELRHPWKSLNEILRLYRFILLGYYLLGDEGIMYRWQFRGAAFLRRFAKFTLGTVTRASVPGWYDTHARLGSAIAGEPLRAIAR